MTTTRPVSTSRGHVSSHIILQKIGDIITEIDLTAANSDLTLTGRMSAAEDEAERIAQVTIDIVDRISGNEELIPVISSLVAQSSTLDTQVGTLNTQVSTLDTQVSTLDTQSSTLNTQVGTLDAQVGTLNTQVSAIDILTQNTATLAADNATDNAANASLIATLTSALSTLQDTVTGIASQMGIDIVTGTLHDSLAALIVRVDTMQSRLTSLFMA